MNSAAAGLRPWGAGALFGGYAAAIAVAPDWRTKTLLSAPALLIPLAWWILNKPYRWLTLFFASALLLPPLPIAIGDSGPHVCLLFAAFGLIAGILCLPNWLVDLRGPGAPLLVLLGTLTASVASAAFYSGLVPAAGSLVRVALFGIAVYVYFYPRGAGDCDHSGAPRIGFLFCLATLSALLAAVDFYFQFPAPAGYEQQFVWLDSGVYRRAQGVFYEASTLGNLCAFFLVMIAVALARPRESQPAPRRALLLCGPVFLVALVLSYSRASLVNVIVAVTVLAWLNRRRLRLARVAAALAAGGVAGALLLWRLFPALALAYWLRLSASAEYFFSSPEGVLSGRLSTWNSLAGWIAAHPWQTLFGIGYKTLPYTDYLGAPVIADNMYLSVLVEAGISGLVALIWLNVAILRASWRATRAASPLRAFCGTWMLCFWAGEVVQMASGDILTYWRILPVYFWVLSLAVRT
jgi:O-antigen ligase